MKAAVRATPAKPRVTKIADDAYADAVVGMLRARLHEVSASTAEPLESILGPASEFAARVAAAVPAVNSLATAIGPVYRQAGLAAASGCSRQAVHEWVRNRRVLTVTTSDGVVLIPAFQLDHRLRPLPGLEQVLSTLSADVVDDWTLAVWLQSPQRVLGGDRVIDRVAAGDLPSALSAATAARRRWLP